MKYENLSISFHICFYLFFIVFIKINAQSTPPIIPSKLSRSDIPFSPRWYWYSRLPDNIENEIDNLTDGLNSKADEFYANRFLWTYKEFIIPKDPTSGYPSISFPEFAADYLSTRSSQYAVPLQIDENLALSFFNGDSIIVESMIARNLCGDSLRSSWEILQGWPYVRPDYNSADFLNFQIDQIKSLVDDGNISFHQDNVAGNEASVNFGGSFSEVSMIKFREWLSANLNASELADLNIGSIATFNYKTYLLDNLSILGLTEEECNCLFTDIKETPDNTMGKLKYYFREFQKDATLEYYQSLHTAIDNYITSKNFGVNKTKGTYSANNHQRNKWLNIVFDFWVSELYPKDNENGLVYDITKIARFGRSSFYEHDLSKGDVVNSITVARTSVETNQNSIALSYASGMTMIAPWDVYIAPINKQKQDRFYGNSNDYSDLFSFVSNNKNLLDGYNTVEEHTYSFLNYYDKISNMAIYDSNRDTITLLRNSAPKNIPVGSRIKVADSVFTTPAGTGVGNIYLPSGSINTVEIGNPVYYLDLKVGDNSYTRYFDDTYRSKRPINNPDIDITTAFVTSKISRESPSGWSLNWTDRKTDLSIPKNSIVNIDGIEYYTITGTNVGLIYLSVNDGNEIDVLDSPSIWYIKDGDNIIYPTEDRPFAINVRSKKDYRTYGVITAINQTGSSTNEKTSLGWSKPSSNMIIPKGSRVLINDREYLTHSLTENGTLHFASDTYLQEGTFKVGDDVWYIKDPVGNIIYPERQFNDAVMHIVNLSDQPRKVAIKVKNSQFTTSFNEVFSPNSASQIINEKTINDYKVCTISNLVKWSILKQDINISGLKYEGLKKNINIIDQVTIYPNTNNGNFEIKISGKLNATSIHIYNIIGLEVYSTKEIKKITNVNISNNSSGIYFVRIQTPKEIITKKIIIK